MTRGARALVIIVCFRNFVLGVALLVAPDRFLSPAFSVLSEVPLMLWGALALAVAVITGAGALRLSEVLARIGVAASAATSLVWAAGYTYAVVTVPLSAPTGAIAFAAFTAMEYVIAGSPMALPYSRVLRDRPTTGTG